MKIVNKFQVVMYALLVMAVLQLQAPDCAEAGNVLDDVMYAGVWCPKAGTTENFHAMAKEIFDEEKNGQRVLNAFVIDLLKNKHPDIAKKIGLYFPEKSDADKHDADKPSKLFTLVLSRATDTLIKHNIDNKYLEQHFFDVTISLVIVNPQTSVVEYSRVLTGEKPVIDGRKVTELKKKMYFKKVIEKTIVSLIKKAANEFKTNYSGTPETYFQVTHIKLKDDAVVLKDYENDLMQFLHDALILSARDAGIKVRFLPPKSKWDVEIWERYKARFNVGGDADYGSKKREELIGKGMYLSISTIIQKAKKAVLKENEIETYYSYLVYTAAAVVQRDKDMKKIAVLPRKRSKKVVRGSGEKTLHQVKDFSKGTTSSDTFLYLDAVQESLWNLSKELIKLCEEAMDELRYS